MTRLLKFLFRPEAWLVLAANGGSFKSLPVFTFLPIDFVPLALGVALALMVARLGKGSWSVTGATICAFLSLLPFSLYYIGRAWGADTITANTKQIMLLGLCVLLFALSLVWTAPLWPRARHFLVAQASLGALMSLPCIFYRFWPSADLNSDQIPGFNDSITLSTSIAIGAVALVVLIMFMPVSYSRPGWRWGQVLLLGLMSVALLVSGAKGPLFAAAGAIFSVVVLQYGGRLRMKFLRSRSFILRSAACAIGLAMLLLLQPSQMVTLQRAALSFSEESASVSTRVERIIIAVQLWQAAPLIGLGPGSSAATLEAHYGSPDYVHNVVLELLADVGVIGLLLFAPVMLPPGGAIFISNADNSRPLAVAMAACALCGILCALSSGKLTDHRQLFLFAGLTLGVLTASRSIPFATAAPSVCLSTRPRPTEE